jgi:hypothetical protein
MTYIEMTYRKLSSRDILRWEDEYKTEGGTWMKVYGKATGSHHTVGMHPYWPGTEYRRPVPKRTRRAA